ncbi:DUF707 domain-containing protein [Flavitalea antarctica]
MISKNIVIAPCGNKSRLFKDSWLKASENRDFDLCLLFYHEEINDPSLYEDADYFFHLKGFKYHMLHELFTSLHPEWLDKYEYFYFLDDDIEISTDEINKMFYLSRAFQSAISQAALSPDSFCSWPMFKQQKNSFCRFVGQIEVMAPLFESQTLRICLPSFVGNRSSWGVDSVWSKILEYPENRLIVFDSVLMRHTLPVGGGELYKKIGVNPEDEWKAITNSFKARKHNYREYGRLQIVNRKTNWPIYAYHRSQESLARMLQIWNDYDLPSRIKSRSNNIIWKKK